jgi:hypothetical protein
MRWTKLRPQPPSPGVAPPTARVTPARRQAVRIRPRIPGADHPWRRTFEQRQIDQQLAADRKAHAAVNP